MNKDVIYIEPEDDITDIITKIENSKERIVALVPPKKAGTFRSIVNIKLIAKAGTKAKKNIVLVTTDSSIIKLAAATRLLVTKDLQSAPAIPEISKDVVEDDVKKEDLDEPSDDDSKGNTDDEKDDEDEDEDTKKASSKNKSDSIDRDKKQHKHEPFQSKFKNPVLKWMDEHRKVLILSGIGGILLILLLVWAFVIAPSVIINIGIRTTNNNFSEGVRFTTKLEEENLSEGKFYLTEMKAENKTEVEFEATGSKNIGEKATGSITVSARFDITGNGGSVTIAAGSLFKKGDLAYVADSDATIYWDGDLTTLNKDCENGNNTEDLRKGCIISKTVNVTAEAPGTQYNITASSSGTGWSISPVTRAEVVSSSAMTGGTDEIVTVVQQSDIDKALQNLGTAKEEANKAALIASIDDSSFPIESSFRQTTGDAVSTPAVNEKVENNKKAKLSVTTTSTIFVLDKTKVEEFIAEKAKLADNYKIYSMNDPFVENFIQSDSGYVGKLKTSYVSGPEVTENSIVETVRGKGIGSAQHDLKDSFNGISSIKIDPSYPWVTSIPDDPNRITVIIDIEE